MLLIPSQIKDYYSDVSPYIKDRIFVDSGIIYDFIDGIVDTRFGKKVNKNLDRLNLYLETFKLKDSWNMFYITPHVLSEVCAYLQKKHNKHIHFPQIVNLILPVLKDMNDINTTGKNKVLSYIDLERPVIEIGDLSIYLATDDYTQTREKVAILTKDWGFNEKYSENDNVLIMHIDLL